MNRHIYRLVAAVLAAITIVSCNDARKSETYRLLEDVDSYIEARPDSALAVLEGIDKSELTSKELEAKYALLLSQALDKNYIDLQSDSIIAPAVRYYENHGTPDERLKMYYYSGRIKQNSGDYEGAMERFVKGESYGNECTDKALLGRLYRAKMTIHREIFNYPQAILDAKDAANCYLEAGDTTRYLSTILNLAILYNDSEKPEEYFAECMGILKENWDILTNSQKSKYYAISIMNVNLTKDEMQTILEEYMTDIKDSALIHWTSVAFAHTQLDRPESGLEALENYMTYNSGEIDASYSFLLAQAQEKVGNLVESLEAYKNYMRITDDFDLKIFDADTKFIEERYKKEIELLDAEHSKERIMFISIIAILCAVIVIYLIRKQLLIRTAEKKQLEIEKKRYEQLYADAIAERDALTKMIEENTVNEGTKVIIERRLELLNKVIVSYITDTSAANRKANEELEALVSDRDMFITSTRMTLESSHPAFFRYLREKELTDWEINYCCLYLIGLKGKDIGEYINLKRHYTYGSVIRQKLGLTENDTNLSIHLKKLLENPRA